MQYYASQGFYPRFYPYKGYLHFMTTSLKEHKDMLYLQSHFAKEHPNSKGMVFNVKDYVFLILFDLKLKKSFYLNSDKYIKRKTGPTNFLQEVLGDENLLFSEHEQWKSRRKIISKAFNFEFIRSLSPVIVTTSASVFQEIISKGDLDSINIMNMFQEITGRTFVNSFFGEDMSQMHFEGENMTSALNTIIMKHGIQGFQMFSFIFGQLARKYHITQEQKDLHQKKLRFKEKIGSLIKAKHDLYLKKELPQNNLLSILFDETPEMTQSALENLIHEYITLYFAGTDTTGHLLAHMVMMILKNPETKAKLLDEIEKTPGLEDDKISWDTVSKMPYLYAFMKETLRVKTAVADIQQRVVIKDFKLDDILVKKGTVISSGLSVSNYDPGFYEEAGKFMPERWMKGGKNEKSEDSEPFLFIPFSAGNRNCIGQHLAKFEALVILVKFLKKFDFKWKNENYKEAWVLRVLYEPKEQLILTLKLK